MLFMWQSRISLHCPHCGVVWLGLGVGGGIAAAKHCMWMEVILYPSQCICWIPHRLRICRSHEIYANVLVTRMVCPSLRHTWRLPSADVSIFRRAFAFASKGFVYTSDRILALSESRLEMDQIVLPLQRWYCSFHWDRHRICGQLVYRG